MNSSDVHSGKPFVRTDMFETEPLNPVLEFTRGFFGEREGHDIFGFNSKRFLRFEDFYNTARDHLSFPGASAGNYLQVSIDSRDGARLRWRVVHLIPRFSRLTG